MSDSTNPHAGVSCVILAGGRSRRMRQDKVRLPLPGGTVIDQLATRLRRRFEDLIISTSADHPLELLGCRTVFDRRPDTGPLGGLLGGLQAAAHDAVFVIAGDIPEVDDTFLNLLLEAATGVDIAVPVTPGGHYEPLLAVYHRRVIPIIETLLDTGVHQVLQLFSRCRTRYVSLESSGWLRNLNTPADYHDYLEELRQRSRKSSGSVD